MSRNITQLFAPDADEVLFFVPRRWKKTILSSLINVCYMGRTRGRQPRKDWCAFILSLWSATCINQTVDKLFGGTGCPGRPPCGYHLWSFFYLIADLLPSGAALPHSKATQENGHPYVNSNHQLCFLYKTGQKLRTSSHSIKDLYGNLSSISHRQPCWVGLSSPLLHTAAIFK